MKNHTTSLLMTFLMVLALSTLSACGQKGPLIIDSPSTNPSEVSDKDSVLNTQTEERSTTR